MKIRKYYGHIKSRVIILILVIAMISFSSLMVRSDSITLVLLAWFLPCVALTLLTCVSVLSDIYAIKGSHISDTILISEKGISEIKKSAYKKTILWDDIYEIKKKTSLNLCPRIFIVSVSGETIWWYAWDKKGEKYIFERHPGLKDLFIKN